MYAYKIRMMPSARCFFFLDLFLAISPAMRRHAPVLTLATAKTICGTVKFSVELKIQKILGGETRSRD
jgi:hypothetical protein